MKVWVECSNLKMKCQVHPRENMHWPKWDLQKLQFLSPYTRTCSLFDFPKSVAHPVEEMEKHKHFISVKNFGKIYADVCNLYLPHPIPEMSTAGYEHMRFEDWMEVLYCLYQEILQRLHTTSHIWLINSFLRILDYLPQFCSTLNSRLHKNKEVIRYYNKETNSYSLQIW